MGSRGTGSERALTFHDVNLSDMQHYQGDVSPDDLNAMENFEVETAYTREATDWDRKVTPDQIDENGKITYTVSTGSNTSAYINSPGGKKINAALREGKQLRGKLRKAMEALDRNMKPLKESINLYRNVSPNYLKAIGFNPKNPGATVGTKVTEKAFMSTSTDLSNNIFNNRNTVMKIQTPKGSYAYISKNTRESEIVLARNSSYTITKVARRKGGWEITVKMEG